MKKLVLGTAFFQAVSAAALAQMPSGEAERAAMAKLDSLAGIWTGEG